MPNQKDSLTLPQTNEFLRWVKRSLADLSMRPSNFLLDPNKPGSINRLSNIYKNPSSLKLGEAQNLELEIRTAAASKDVELLPLNGSPIGSEVAS